MNNRLLNDSAGEGAEDTEDEDAMADVDVEVDELVDACDGGGGSGGGDDDMISK